MYCEEQECAKADAQHGALADACAHPRKVLVLPSSFGDSECQVTHTPHANTCEMLEQWKGMVGDRARAWLFPARRTPSTALAHAHLLDA